MNPFIPDRVLKQGLKQYRRDVPSVGTVSYERTQQLLAEGKICRGWTDLDGKRQYFHIVKSPTHYPDKTVFFGDREEDLFTMMVHLGMQRDIPLEDFLID